MAEYENKHSALTSMLATLALVLLVLALVLIDTKINDSSEDIDDLSATSSQENPGAQIPSIQTEVEVAGRLLKIPEGFQLSEYATGLNTPRFMTFNDSGTLFVGSKKSDKIVAVSDGDGDGFAESQVVIDQNLKVPHSVVFHDGDLYVAEEDKISAYRGISPEGSYSEKVVLVEGLPAGSGHNTRTLAIGPDHKMYLSVGSSCNVCEEGDNRRATVMRYNLDGSGSEIFASGLRNSVGLVFDELDQLWAVDNGRDQIGDDLPPEELNIILGGRDYGWPYCYGQGIANPEYQDKVDFCQNETEYTVFEMQAHSAPLGIDLVGPQIEQFWPDKMKNSLIMAFHGSWNRSVPTGYKVVWIDRSTDSFVQRDLITGWLDEETGKAWGRPVGLTFDQDGKLYISDDEAGKIYRLSYISD